jgi:hypothetical protein
MFPLFAAPLMGIFSIGGLLCGIAGCFQKEGTTFAWIGLCLNAAILLLLAAACYF